MLHRDLKPSNVLLGLGPSDVRLADLGLARLERLGDSEARPAIRGGSLPYMAPEQFGDDEALEGPWTDLYSVGCLTWAMVCGHPPFATSSWTHARRRHAFDELPPLSVRRAVPPDLIPWLHALLRKDPMDRPRSAADVLHALQQLGDPSPETVTPLLAPARMASSLETFQLDEAIAPAPVPLTSPAEAEGATMRPPPFPEQAPDRVDHHAPATLLDAGLALSIHRPWRVMGWREERESLWRWLGEVVARPVPQVVALTGGPDRGAHLLAGFRGCLRGINRACADGIGGDTRQVRPSPPAELSSSAPPCHDSDSSVAGVRRGRHRLELASPRRFDMAPDPAPGDLPHATAPPGEERGRRMFRA